MMKNVKTHVVCLSIVALLPTQSIRAQSQPAELREAMALAWQRREQSIRSLAIKWTERETLAKGHLSDLYRRAGGEQAMRQMGVPLNTPFPATDLSFDIPCSLDLDGDSLLYQRETRAWSAKEQTFVPSPFLCSYDGATGKYLSPQGTPYTPWAQGIIHKVKYSPELHSNLLFPVIMAARAMTPDLRFLDTRDFTPTGRRAVVARVSCLALERSRSSVRETVWLDPARDYSILRHVVLRDEQPVVRIDVNYRSTSDIWLPDSWAIVTMSRGGKIDQSIRATVSSVTVNPAINPRTFALEFPLGTRVSDQKSKEEYIIKPTGGKRVILPADIGATYQQMLETRPGGARGTKRSWGETVSLAVAGVVGAVAAGLLLWRRLLRRAAR